MVATSVMGFAHAAVTTPGSIAGSVEFTGSIVSDTCKITTPSGSSNGIVNVNMGSVPVDEVGTVDAPKFAVSASANALTLTILCKEDASVDMHFAAIPSNTDTASGNKILKLNSASTAGNVGIAVYQTGSHAALDLTKGLLLDKAALKTGQPLQVQFDAAYVVLSAGSPTAGTANASLPFVLSYN